MPSPYVADITPLLQGLQHLTPRGREDRAFELEKREAALESQQQQKEMQAIQMQNAMATQKRNQLTDVANQNRAMLIQKQSDIKFSMKDGPEGLLNNLTILARDKDPESMELKNIIDIRNLAVSDPQAAFDRIQNENLFNVERGLEVTNKILTGLEGRAGFSAKTVGYKDGTAVQWDNQGNRVVTSPEGERLTGKDAAAQIQEARKSGIADQGERSAARAGGKVTGEAVATAKSASLIAKTKSFINTQVKLAEKAAIERGDVLTDLGRAKAALPGLNDVVDKLRELAPVATSTLGGRVWDTAVKEFGFGATKGATASAKFGAMVNNQVLPLLKPTFGAAFTKQEGDALRATMGDKDASVEEKMATLDAFIEQKVRDIETKKLQLNQSSEPEAPVAGAELEEGMIITNPSTGERM
jgi:hypothetical protein